MIGNKLSASITFIRYCLCTQRVMHLIKHTENVMPSTNIDGIALNDKIINKPNHTKKYKATEIILVSPIPSDRGINAVQIRCSIVNIATLE